MVVSIGLVEGSVALLVPKVQEFRYYLVGEVLFEEAVQNYEAVEVTVGGDQVSAVHTTVSDASGRH